MKASVPLVDVVDNHVSVQESVPECLETSRFSVQAFSYASTSLVSDLVGKTRCLVPEVAMPGMTRPDLQPEVARRHQPEPMVNATARGDDCVRARLLEVMPVECAFRCFSIGARYEPQFGWQCTLCMPSSLATARRKGDERGSGCMSCR